MRRVLGPLMERVVTGAAEEAVAPLRSLEVVVASEAVDDGAIADHPRRVVVAGVLSGETIARAEAIRSMAAALTA